MAEFLPADFEIRGPGGGIVQAMLDDVSEQQGVAAYNDEPGLLVLPEVPPPVFSRIRADVIAGRNVEGTVTAIRDAYEARLTPDERTLLAFEMFTAAESMPPGDADSRFLMLMIAIEALIEPGHRPQAQVDAIDTLKQQLASIDGLTPADADALRSALGQLKDESIGSAGRRLASSLGGRTYLEMSADKFFTACYTARSNLVHGNVERPDANYIRSLIGPLLHFVRDLIRERGGATWAHPRELPTTD